MHEQMTAEKKTATRNSIWRLLFTLIGISLQIALIVSFFTTLNGRWSWVQDLTQILTFILVLFIYSQHKTSSMKTPWIILILVLPVFGIVMYLLVGLNGSTYFMKKRYQAVDEELLPHLHRDPLADELLKERHPELSGVSRYLEDYAFYPLYQNTRVRFFQEASMGLEAMKEDLRKASHYIFMEYHAIEEKESWKGIEDILKEKAAQGVEVRIFYDDMGSIGFLDGRFIKRMEAMGIQCRDFNPVMPGLNVFLNNRDHRKITVIDGEIGYTGGYNLANEYFNVTHPYGHWKDTGIRLEGDAVRSLLVTFLENWNAMKDPKLDDTEGDIARYIKVAEKEERADEKREEKRAEEQIREGKLPDISREGFVQPYADNPIDNENVGENVYISLIEQAEDYCWFITPYLIITDEMNHALSLAAKRGVDVRIITPGIPDKKLIYQITRSYYNGLVRNGVRIYEYTPGFCHAKMCVTDDIAATCGTINLDYRSLYHHFENGCLIVDDPVVTEIHDDFLNTMEQCREVTKFYKEGRTRRLRLWQMFLRLFAELL